MSFGLICLIWVFIGTICYEYLILIVSLSFFFLFASFYVEWVTLRVLSKKSYLCNFWVKSLATGGFFRNSVGLGGLFVGVFVESFTLDFCILFVVAERG